MQWIDWLVVVVYLGFTLCLGLYLGRKASGSLVDFFVSGRSLPWWLAGTSMVATTFAVDTPLAVTELVAQNGIAGNWLWWNLVMSGILTVFFYARLWRRAGVITDVEFTEIRYGGKPAALLRGFRAAYLAVPINLIIMGWVNLAMMEIVATALGISDVLALLVCFALAGGYSVLAGLWGVVVTDFFQFTLAVDRANEQVSQLHTPFHPAVLRLIEFAIQAALRARKPVSICGEIAGDPRLTGLLIGLGFRELSMSAASIPLVKRRILELDVGEATQRAQLIMTQSDSARIQALLEESEALPLTLGT